MFYWQSLKITNVWVLNISKIITKIQQSGWGEIILKRMKPKLLNLVEWKMWITVELWVYYVYMESHGDYNMK